MQTFHFVATLAYRRGEEIGKLTSFDCTLQWPTMHIYSEDESLELFLAA